MPRSELRDLLPSSVVSNHSRGEVLQQLTMVSSGGQAVPGVPAGSSTEGLSNAMQGSLRDFTSQLSTLTEQMTSLGAVQQTQVSATQDNTQALAQNTAVKGSSGSSIGSTLGGIASTLFGGGLSPLIGGFMSLFGGSGGGQTPTVASIFRLPNPIDFQGGLEGSTGQVAPVSYGQTGQPRSQPISTASQVTVQVNAIDSQSFIDHSDEIASAVKAAILSSHSLNDVIADL